MRPHPLLVSVGLILCGTFELSAADAITPLLTRHCVACHGPKVQKAKLRLDTLSTDFNGPARDTWATVLERLANNEMPPKDQPRLAVKDHETLTSWIAQRLRLADSARRKKEGRTVLRRLNRQEYQNTVRDLFAIDVSIKESLPEDTTKYGFDNVGSALSLSSILMERYLEAADTILDQVLLQEKKPEPILKKYSYKNEKRMLENTRLFLEREDGVVFFSSGYSPTTLGNFRASVPGKYRVRISAAAYQSAKPVTYRVHVGDMFRLSGIKHLAGYFDVTSQGEAREFIDHFEKGDTLVIVPFGTGEGFRKTALADFKGSGLLVRGVEIEGPLGETWPSASQRLLFGDVPLKVVPRLTKFKQVRDHYEPTSQDPLADAEKVLRKFIPRAFRRPVADAEIAPFLKLVRNRLEDKDSFADALRVGLKGVLCSPHFLYLRETPGELDDFAVASRLSYFLWSSTPDEELLAAARRGELRQPDVLRRQTERLLKDARARAFTENFLGQWLDLRKIEFTTPDRRLYPDFDELLEMSSVKETQLFFEELLSKDLSIDNFLASDFSMLNERLAVHYGIEGVEGQEFRKVALPAGGVRGGVLTQASVLRVTANGTTTSPVVRGAWVLERILGKPAPPPPPGVPAVEPDIRGTATIRAQLAKHRQVESCAVCHNKIDPPGFALECFDVIGGLRDQYRVQQQGKRITTELFGRRISYAVGPKVDNADVLPDGRRFANFVEFRKLLLAERGQFARALTEKLLIYATGAGLDFDDQDVVAQLARSREGHGPGLRALVHEVVQSPLFRRK